ncbi:DUF4097 family beta strand repeat-containing protein [Saccharothrix luteola]|uniref:DUF4097 family beta strand repeat-containing protein n=1 Tax=Saccharothrix luteola TaxID=2893018 RepID=UPI001E4CEF37|nr:DUF4097 family beta strand repeat-containing protein [Saccharothrix luteola]MCC8250042.1 DUF4097 family beta strand repeat-containing protein [Saccharothrix luteola]
MPTFTTPGPIAATVVVAGALVRVTASDRTETAVLVAPVDSASRADVEVADKTKVDFARGRLSVKTTASGRASGSVAITIDLPAGSSLVTYLAHSTVHADGPLGECELHAASSRVELDRVEALRANISAGEVAVGHVAGRVDVDGSVVAARIDAVGGAVRVSSSGGRTWIGHAASDLDLSSGSGGFDVDRADGGVTARTGGVIRIGRLTRGQAELSNRSGDIEVGIGEGAAARVDAGSKRGSVRNSLARQEDPAAFDDKVTVRARTRHGDIIVRRAAG